MINYAEMALNSIKARDDLKGWVNDLTDTHQFSMAEQLIRIMEGLPLTDDKLFMLAWYLSHCDHQR